MLILLAVTLKGQVFINEIMQSNIDCIMDDLNDFPDSWVEVYNGTSSVINLADYKLGENNSAAEAWQLPNKRIEPKQYAIIYCDKVASGLHTHFRLESGKGGEVYLFKGNNVIDYVTGIKKQPAPNVAYGRERNTDGMPSEKWAYFCEATPGAQNSSAVASDILGEPVFSDEGRVSETKQNIKLTLSLPSGSPLGTHIRYTLDGTEPTASSALYSTPITVNSSMVVRAKLFCKGWLSPRSTVHSYLSLGRRQTLPVVSIVIDPAYLYDSKIGIYVDGTYSKDVKNYEYDWRRPINLELFETDGTTCSINQLCETRIHGGASRGSVKKSMAFYANKRFGEKRFKYEFFPDQRPGQTNYKSFLMRNAGNDFDYLFMRDAVIQSVMAKHVDMDWQAYRPAIVFINGEYHGMLNFRDRSNDDYVFTNYDELEDIDMIENSWELKNGTWDHFNAFKAFYQEHGHTWDEYSKWLDLYEFINIYAMNLFYNNQDFPGNNLVWWRPRTADGKWRIIAKDTDFGLGLYGSPASYNTMEWIYNPNYDADKSWANGYDHTRLFRRLMDNSDFQREFIDRCAIYMADFMNERGTREVWDPMYEAIKTEYPHHRKLVNEWWPNYNDELAAARRWIAERPQHFYNQLAQKYSLGTPLPLSVNMSLAETEMAGHTFIVNGVALSKGRMAGKFFKNRSLTIEAQTSDTAQTSVVGWRTTLIRTDGTQDVTECRTPILKTVMPDCQAFLITAILGEPTGVTEHPHADSCNNTSQLFDISGRATEGALRAGVYILRNSDGTTRKVLFR